MAATRMAAEKAHEIRTRRTFRGDEPEHLDLGVFCERRGLDVPVEECAHCVHCQGMRLASSAPREAVILCAAPDEPAENGAPPADTSRPQVGAAHGTSIASVMTTNVICVGSDLPLQALELLFLEHGVSGTPVVDQAGCPVGMVSKTDLVAHYARRPRRDAPWYTVADVMTEKVHCLPANESIARAAAVMVFEGTHRVPIVDAHGRVVGILAATDVMRYFAEAQGYVLR